MSRAGFLAQWVSALIFRLRYGRAGLAPVYEQRDPCDFCLEATFRRYEGS